MLTGRMRDAALLDAATLAAAEQRMTAATAAIRTNRSTMRERHELSSHPWADPISSRMSKVIKLQKMHLFAFLVNQSNGSITD